MVFEPIYIPRALNTGTCIWQDDLLYSAGLCRNHVLATDNTEEIRGGFGKNAAEWTGRVEISKEDIPGSNRSTDLLQALKGERLSSGVLTRWDFNFCVRSFPTAGLLHIEVQ